MVHHPHIPHRQHTHQNGITEHHDTPAEAFLHGVQIVGEKAHEVAHFVDLIVFTAQLPGMIEHPVAQIFLQPHGAAKEADTPHKTAEDHSKDDLHHLHTNTVQHKIHAERHLHPIDFHITRVHTVDHSSVKLGDLKLQKIHQNQRAKARDQPERIFQIVPVDMFSEYHMAIPFQKVILLPHYTTGFRLWQSPAVKKLRTQQQCAVFPFNRS